MKNRKLVITTFFLAALIMGFGSLIAYAQESFKDFIDESDLAKAQEMLTVIDDPAIAKAMQEYNERIGKIGEKCFPSSLKETEGKQYMDFTKYNACMCENLDEIYQINQIKVDAFADLLKRRPELANKIIRIEGVFAIFYLDPEQVKNDLADLRKQYGCGEVE